MKATRHCPICGSYMNEAPSVKHEARLKCGDCGFVMFDRDCQEAEMVPGDGDWPLDEPPSSV